MSKDLDQWQWVDQDQVEILLRLPKGASEADIAAAGEFGVATQLIEAPDRVDKNPEQAIQSRADSLAADGFAYLAQRRFAEAVSNFSGAVTADPTHAEAHFGLAVALEKQEEWDSASASFRRLLEINPGRADALIGLGACLLHLNDAEGALNCFEKCSFSSTDREQALLGIAVALQKLERDQEADWAYRELLQLAPESIEPLANVIALSMTRKDKSAVADYSHRLLSVDPLSKAALQGLATLAIWDGDHAAVVDYCTRLLDVDPKLYAAWSNLGFAKQRLYEPVQSIRSIA